MSHYLNETEMRQWAEARRKEAARIRPELFNEPPKDIQLSEIKMRLTALQSATCLCFTCVHLRGIIAEIDKAMNK